MKGFERFLFFMLGAGFGLIALTGMMYMLAHRSPTCDQLEGYIVAAEGWKPEEVTHIYLEGTCVVQTPAGLLDYDTAVSVVRKHVGKVAK